MRNVEVITADNNLCVSCGICKSVCPKKCIKFVRENGQYVPEVDESLCISCEICLNVCPGFEVNFDKLYSNLNMEKPNDFFVGSYIECYSSNANDSQIRSQGVSGGCITATVKNLLNSKEYDVAFLVDNYEYNDFIETHLYRKDDVLNNTTKSRYIPVSHSNMIKYILENRNDKVIIVATSCAVQGFLNVISRFKLNRDNYLILGLFCDKTMSYNVYEYFNNYYKSKGELKKLLFRTKENGGWPGDVKLEYKNGQSIFLPAQERMILKDYFQLERCMYCIDKLNQFSDISFGDNYTGKNHSKEGNNSVIIRTNRGMAAWNQVDSYITSIKSLIEDIFESQHIGERLKNYSFAKVKEREIGFEIYKNFTIDEYKENEEIHKLMDSKLKLINIGRNYEVEHSAFDRRIKYLKIKNFAGRVRRYTIKKIRGFVKNE